MPEPSSTTNQAEIARNPLAAEPLAQIPLGCGAAGPSASLRLLAVSPRAASSCFLIDLIETMPSDKVNGNHSPRLHLPRRESPALRLSLRNAANLALFPASGL